VRLHAAGRWGQIKVVGAAIAILTRGRPDAKAKGGVTPGQGGPTLTPHQQEEAHKRIAGDEPQRSIAHSYNVSQATFRGWQDESFIQSLITSPRRPLSVGSATRRLLGRSWIALVKGMASEGTLVAVTAPTSVSASGRSLWNDSASRYYRSPGLSYPLPWPLFPHETAAPCWRNDDALPSLRVTPGRTSRVRTSKMCCLRKCPVRPHALQRSGRLIIGMSPALRPSRRQVHRPIGCATDLQ
jgi:hypothetical protein